MGDSSTIDASKYPSAELADTSDAAYKKVKYVRDSAQVQYIPPTGKHFSCVTITCNFGLSLLFTV